MENVALKRWRVWSGLVLACCALNGTCQPTPVANGEQAVQVASASVDRSTAAKLEKIEQNLSLASQRFQAADFEAALKFYDGVLQLDPKQESVAALKAEAQAMREAQRQALAKLPEDPAERARVLDAAFEQAMQLSKAGEQEKAYQAFRQLWLTSGDYQNKTIKMYRRIEKKLDAEKRLPLTPTGKVAQVTAEVAPAPQAAAPAAPAVSLEAPAVPEVQASAAPAAPAAEIQEAPMVQAQAAVAQAEVTQEARQQVADLMRQSHQLADSGQPAEALKLVHKALDLWPENPECQQMLGQLNGQLGYTRRDQIQTYLAEGDALAADGQFTPAIARYREVLKIDPQNKSALDRIEQTQITKVEGNRLADVQDELALRHEIDKLLTMANEAFEAKDINKARKLWQDVLARDPGNKLATTRLAETEDEAQQITADAEKLQAAESREDARQTLLNAPITISTDHKIPLSEFINALSIATPVELEYYIAEGADTQVLANFVNKPLHEVLDKVLLEVGLSWAIDDKNVVTIKPNLISRTYTLTPEQVTQVNSLRDSGELQQLVWGQRESPAKGVDMTLDERRNILIVTGSQLHIDRIESFLPSLKNAAPPAIIMKGYKIREADGPKIRALINSIITPDSNPAFDIERKVLIEGNDLFIRDTPERIEKIEELLLDRQFIENLRNETLDIANFNLVPREVANAQQTDQNQVFTGHVVEAIKTLLYSREGERQSAEQGRRMWYDEPTMQLTVVDTPENLARVSAYIESLPQLRQGDMQKVIFLQNAVAEDLSASLERILNLTSDSGGVGGADGGETLVKLRRGEEKLIPGGGGARVRLVRVEENDEDDRDDDTAEVSIVTRINVQQMSLRELETQFIDDYEISAEDVIPNTGRPGEGSARIRIRYIPQSAQALGDIPEELLAVTERAQAEELGITINPFGELNAIIIRYSNPALFKQATDLIEQLDKPIRQVQIETKLVEVNETRAKEFSADFTVAGLGSGRDIDLDQQLINSRFAQDIDEFRDVFSPAIENPVNSNLIKGTTVIDAVIGGFPQIQYQLRMLEAEGIINMVNGPKVTSIDGDEAEFRIEKYVPTEAQGAEEGGANILNSFNPFDEAFEDLELADQDETDNENIITAVVLRVTPEITSEKTIILNDLSAELIDFDGWVGEVIQPVVEDINDENEQPYQIIQPPSAIGNPSYQMYLKRKRIVTNARISNGGTIVIGGWTGERSEEYSSGIPVLRNMPYFGKLLFNRAQRSKNRTTLLIFLTGTLVD